MFGSFGNNAWEERGRGVSDYAWFPCMHTMVMSLWVAVLSLNVVLALEARAREDEPEVISQGTLTACHVRTHMRRCVICITIHALSVLTRRALLHLPCATGFAVRA